MTWQLAIDDWLRECQRAGGLHMLSGSPDPGQAPSIAFVCIPSFPGFPVPDDLRVKLRPEQFFECVRGFPRFPNVMSMIGDGWLYWNAYLSGLPHRSWVRRRVAKAIRITVHRTLSQELLVRLLAHESLYDGVRCIVLGLEDGGAVALFDNPKVNAVYAIQKIHSPLALAELRRMLVPLEVTPIEDPRSIVDFELLYWIIHREFTVPP